MPTEKETSLRWVRERFYERGFGYLRSVPVVIEDADSFARHCGGSCSSRTVAFYDTEGDVIVLSKRLSSFPLDVQRGVIAHEFGHAVDFHEPGSWMLLRGKTESYGLAYVEHVSSTQRLHWEQRRHDTIERTADRIAEYALAKHIGYSVPLMLQTLGTGVRPRPTGLR